GVGAQHALQVALRGGIADRRAEDSRAVQKQRGVVRIGLECAIELEQRAFAISPGIENERQVVARLHVLGVTRQQLAIRRGRTLDLATLARLARRHVQGIVGYRSGSRRGGGGGGGRLRRRRG